MNRLKTDPAALRTLTVPAVTLLLALLGLCLVPGLSSPWAQLLVISPYLTAMAGMLLAVHFHRGRPFFILLTLAVFYWCYRSFLAGGLELPAEKAVFHALCTVMPLNLFVFTLIPERGIFTEAGKVRLAALAAQAFVTYFLFHYHFAELQPLFENNLLNLSTYPLTISQPSLLLFLGAFLGLLFLVMLNATPMAGCSLGVLAALFIAVSWLTTPHVATLFCLAAGIIATTGILRESYNLAFRDDLTGIPSRRALNETLYGVGTDFAIAMVDIDHFKKFNDTYGHDVGDQVLRLVAAKLARVGGGGRTFRYGGEEFTILFERLRAEETEPHLEALRREIEEYPLVIRGEDRPKENRQGKKRRTGTKDGVTTTVTISIGVAESCREQQTPKDVILAADRALYRAKEQGRNQVCRALPSRPGKGRDRATARTERGPARTGPEREGRKWNGNRSIEPSDRGVTGTTRGTTMR